MDPGRHSLKEQMFHRLSAFQPTRSAKSIAKRAIALNQLLSLAHDGISLQNLKQYLQTSGIWKFLTPNEKELFTKKELDQDQKNQLSWRREALHALLWALNCKVIMSAPTQESGIDESILVRIEEDPKWFIKHARLRPVNEIMDQLEETYQLHWKIRDSETNNGHLPFDYEIGVVYQRHYALNWVTRYQMYWDDITTDT